MTSLFIWQETARIWEVDTGGNITVNMRKNLHPCLCIEIWFVKCVKVAAFERFTCTHTSSDFSAISIHIWLRVNHILSNFHIFTCSSSWDKRASVNVLLVEPEQPHNHIGIWWNAMFSYYSVKVDPSKTSIIAFRSCLYPSLCKTSSKWCTPC